MQHEARQSILPNGLVIEHELGMSAHGANRILSLKVPAAIAQAFPLHNETVATSGWEHVGVPVGTAFAVGLVWLVCGIFVRRTAKPRWGSELDEFGMPIWRCVTGLWSQCFVFPALFLCSLAQWGFSMQAWQQASGEHLFTPDGQRYYDWAFVYIFAGYMVEDFVLHRCSALMVAHHAGCLLGLAFAFIGVPAGEDPPPQQQRPPYPRSRPLLLPPRLSPHRLPLVLRWCRLPRARVCGAQPALPVAKGPARALRVHGRHDHLQRRRRLLCPALDGPRGLLELHRSRPGTVPRS